MGKIPDTGNEISMGRISRALGLTSEYPPPSGSNISLNAGLGANRSNAISPVSDIPSGSDTWESSDFGGLETSEEYDDTYGFSPSKINYNNYTELIIDPESLLFELSGKPQQQITIEFEGGDGGLNIIEDETWINWEIESGSLTTTPCVINVWCDEYQGKGRSGKINITLKGTDLTDIVFISQTEKY